MSDNNNITEVELILRIRNLSLQQRKVVADVITELNQVSASRESGLTGDNEGSTVRRSTLGQNQGARLIPRNPNTRFIDSSGVALSLGDRTRINNTRAQGTAGDIAEVVKFNRKYVAVEILATGIVTQRSSSNLTFLE